MKRDQGAELGGVCAIEPGGHVDVPAVTKALLVTTAERKVQRASERTADAQGSHRSSARLTLFVKKG